MRSVLLREIAESPNPRIVWRAWYVDKNGLLPTSSPKTKPWQTEPNYGVADDFISYEDLVKKYSIGSPCVTCGRQDSKEEYFDLRGLYSYPQKPLLFDNHGYCPVFGQLVVPPGSISFKRHTSDCFVVSEFAQIQHLWVCRETRDMSIPQIAAMLRQKHPEVEVHSVEEVHSFNVYDVVYYKGQPRFINDRQVYFDQYEMKPITSYWVHNDPNGTGGFSIQATSDELELVPNKPVS